MTIPLAPQPLFFEQEILFDPSPRLRLANLALRLVSLALKLALTLYMGATFNLDAIGAYGLVFAAVMIANSFLGQEVGHISMREIVSASRTEALRRIRDQIVWHSTNYLVLGLALGALASRAAFGVAPVYYLFIFLLSVTENLGSMLHFSLNARNQQLAANIMLFVRAATWVPVVIGLCLYDPAYCNETVVLGAWSVGSALALLFPLWLWRDWGWRKVLATPVDWDWIRRCVRKSLPIWVGLMGTIAGGYIDRYVIGHFLDLRYVGVMTFFYSFINACFPLLESGLLAFATTRLIALYDQKKDQDFNAEAARVMAQTTAGTALLVAGLFVGVPILCLFLNRAAFLDELPTFWLLTASLLVNGPAMAAAAILFARRQDRSLWLGNLLFLIPILICNFTLVPAYGFAGIGYSALISGLMLFVWRLFAIGLYHRR